MIFGSSYKLQSYIIPQNYVEVYNPWIEKIRNLIKIKILQRKYESKKAILNSHQRKIFFSFLELKSHKSKQSKILQIEKELHFHTPSTSCKL